MTTAKATLTKTTQKIDPLYTIFEQHLYNFQDSDSDRKTFIAGIVSEYLTYLRRSNIVVPKSLEASIAEELGTQVNTMLVKKIYGMHTIQDFKKKVPKTVRKKAQAKYARLGRR